jgi:anti-sigma B factor antagonist
MSRPIPAGGDPTVSEPTTPPRQTDSFELADELGLELSRPGPDVAVLAVTGEIDSLTTPALERGLGELLAVAEPLLVIDLSDVTFLASSGLAALIRAAQRLEPREQRLRLVATGRAVRRPLEVTGSDQLFDLFSARESATGDRV